MPLMRIKANDADGAGPGLMFLSAAAGLHLAIFNPKFKSGVSVKLQSSVNKFQEAMSAKICILRLV